MHPIERCRDSLLVAVISSIIIVNAFLFFLSRDHTFVHIDAIAHVNKARGLFDNIQPGLRQLGTVWLPLPHILMAPLAAIDALWRSGAAGSLLSVVCFIGSSVFLFLTGFRWTGSRIVGWLAFLLFALNPHLIYLFSTPENEPLMILCAGGLMYYLIRWIQDENWTDFAFAAVFAFAGTWTRYEGWAMAAAAAVLVPIVTRKRRVASSIIFAGAATTGPMLWMLFNLVYFDDPLMFLYGAGSAQDYASRAKFVTAGNWSDSAVLYFMDAAYCLNPAVIWLGIGGIIVSLAFIGRRYWRPTVVLVAGCVTIFAFYTVNLYLNVVPITMPGMLKNDPQSVMNVRYGSLMAASMPLFAALFIFVIWRQVERRRAFSLFLLAPLFLPDPIPSASHEPMEQQFTQNLFYTEAIHNQSFWMPPFVDVAKKLKADIDGRDDRTGLILANTRIVHVVVWATGIAMRRFVTEMNKDPWESSLQTIAPGIRWVITEEGDWLWNAQGKFLSEHFIDVATAKTEATRPVHLYRRPE
jgi:hypothetical protein